jgi:parvulin-like peptidyl-prolyl isomerase
MLITLIATLIAKATLAAEDRIIAVVNGEAITQRDAEEYLNTLYIQLASQYDLETVSEKIREAQKDVVKNLIENQLIIQEAKQQNIEVDSSLVEQELEYIKSRFDSDEEFEQGMLGRGLSLADIKKKITDKILMREIIEREVRSHIFVHPREVTEYYRQNIEKFRIPEQIELDSIFIPFDESNDRARRIANKVVALLKTGEDFEVVQRQYSALKSLGLVERASLKKEIQDALLALDTGDISSPIKTEDGFFILRIKTVFPERLQDLDKVQDAIYEFVFQKKFQERFAQWIDELKERAFIIIK